MSGGSDENLKLEGLTVVDSLTAQLVLETLMIPMMIQYQKEPTVINVVCFRTGHVLGGQ